MIKNPFITHDDLIKIGAKWLKTQHSDAHEFGDCQFHHSSCGVILTEFISLENSIPDVIGFNNYCSIVIECKISHQDFLADLKKPHRNNINPKQCGNYRYYLTLPEIILPDEVNNGWGLLYATDKFVKIIKPPVIHTEPQIKVAEYSILYSLARRIELKGLIKNALTPFVICDLCKEPKEHWTRNKLTHQNICDDCLKKIGDIKNA